MGSKFKFVSLPTDEKCIYTTDKKACHIHVSGKHNGNTWLLQLAWHQPQTNHYLIKRNTILNFK